MKHVSVSPADFSNLDTVSCVLLCKPVFICGMLGEEGGGGGIWDSQKSCNDIKMHPLNFKRFLLLLSVHPSIIISVRMKVQNDLA